MIKAKIREMGMVMTQEEPDGHPPDNTYPYALVLQFDSPEQLREALKDNQVEFETF